MCNILPWSSIYVLRCHIVVTNLKICRVPCSLDDLYHFLYSVSFLLHPHSISGCWILSRGCTQLRINKDLIISNLQIQEELVKMMGVRGRSTILCINTNPENNNLNIKKLHIKFFVSSFIVMQMLCYESILFKISFCRGTVQ